MDPKPRLIRDAAGKIVGYDVEDCGITWESADNISHRITKQIREEFGSSKPRPRNRVMGFRTEHQDRLARKFQKVKNK